MKTTYFIIVLMAMVIASCTIKTKPNVKVSGDEKSEDTIALEKWERLFQENAPVAQMDVHLVGLHPMKDHPTHQMEAHHFCRQMNEDFAQCALFDGNSKEANLNGVEYIISEKLFNTLPTKEKKFWHPHNYEILSGQLTAPGLPAGAEKDLMRKTMNSYGKTWHVWNTGHFAMKDATSLPTGEPALAWSFNHDGEVKPELEKKLEKKFEISFKDKRRRRKELVKDAHPQVGVNDLKKKFPGKLVDIPGVQDSKTVQAQEAKKR